MKKLLIVNNEKDMDDLGWIPIIKDAILNVEKTDISVIHHSEISKEKMESLNPDLIYLTGRVTYDWTLNEILEDYAAEIELVKNTNIPTLGVCAGEQLIAIAYGADFGKMIEVEEGEEDIRESGYTEIQIIKDAPLFKNLEDKFVCYELHRDEVKSVPQDFELLASTEMCPIQAIKHKSKNIYGIQFHPEQYNVENLDGKIILRNFLDM